MSETTPLLQDSTGSDGRPKDVYDRFSPSQRRRILGVVSMASIMSPFASGCFVPCVPQIAKDLNTSGTVINYTVAVYVCMVAFGNLIWAPYAAFYGRRPIYLASLPLLCFGSLGVGLSMSIAQLVISRTVQAIGASCVVTVGAAAIADVYRLEERGAAMGVLFGTLVLAPAISPLVGGLMATYSSWRVMQIILFAMGFVAFLSIVLFFPETSHPGSRGMDKRLALEEATGLGCNAKARGWGLVFLNPFTQLAILRGPTILLVSIAAAFNLLTDYILLIPMSYTLGENYGIKSPALIGACFLVCGVGNILGAPISGYLSDRAVILGKKKRNGQWVPEDRLTAALPGALLLTPLSVLICGLSIQFIPGKPGLVIDLICLFVNGLGVLIVLTSTSTYYLDVLHTQSAEAMAVGYFFRNGFCGVASAAMLPTINKIGVAATNGIAAMLAWIGFGLFYITIRYGDRLRAWVDIGYTSTIRDS
ncbi:MFS general substrate transporter [Ramaria rubella]|nr:MFS general substrate transporter [Ramaria rubella]